MAEMFDFLKLNRIKSDQILDDTKNFLVKKFKQAQEMFVYSTAYGQILLVVHNINQLLLYYISDIATQNNILTANRTHTIYGLARLSGHDPVRGISAKGEVTLRINTNAINKITGNNVFIVNYSRLSCANNNLQYILQLDSDDLIVNLHENADIRIKVIEGVIDEQSFQGTGEDNQSFTVVTQPNHMIEENFIIVTVNDEKYDIYDSLYDIPFGNKGCVVKTGINLGVDVFFGNSLTSKIPQNGAKITVTYIFTDGSAGNILGKDIPSFKFIDTGFDVLGEDVDLNDIFTIIPSFNPDFGADGEEPELTKILARKSSRNMIIHDEKSIYYFLMKMNYFSVIKVFKEITDNHNMYKIIATPKVKNRLLDTEDYFNMDINKLVLTDTEKTRLINMFDESGLKSSNITIEMQDVKIKRFALILKIEAFKTHNGISIRIPKVKNDIRNVLSEYLLNNERINKLPHSDLVRIIDSIEYVDTVKAVIIAEDDTDIDEYGNVNTDETSIAVIRGGFKDSDGVNYIDEFDPSGVLMGSVKINITLVN